MLLVQEWEEARRSFLEAVAEGRAGAGVEAGSHIHPFPAHSKSPTWHLSKALDVQASPTADDPAEVAKPKCCPSGAQGGVIVHSRKRGCIQYMPSSHQGLKLSFLLSPSCNIPGIFLALLGPEGLCEVLAVARAGQPIGSGDCSRETPKKPNRLSNSCLVSVKEKK